VATTAIGEGGSHSNGPITRDVNGCRSALCDKSTCCDLRRDLEKGLRLLRHGHQGETPDTENERPTGYRVSSRLYEALPGRVLTHLLLFARVMSSSISVVVVVLVSVVT
jgi:hypothetical protein